MKSTKIIISIIVLAALGILGYMLYVTSQDSSSGNMDFEFTSAEIINSDLEDLEDLAIFDVEEGLAELESLDFEESITEENVESVITADAEAEAELDAELDELENLDF